MPPTRVQQTQRYSAVVLLGVTPRVAAGRAKVLARRHGTGPLVLLLVLDLGYLVGVLVAPFVATSAVRVLVPPEDPPPEALQGVRIGFGGAGVPVLGVVEVLVRQVVVVRVVVLKIVVRMVRVVLVVVMVMWMTVLGVMKVIRMPCVLLRLQRFVQQLSAATRGSWKDRRHVLGRSLHQGVCVGRCVTVAKVGTVPTPTDAPGDS